MGIIKSTVLNAKNGVITEERFKNMTLAQWLFHYAEVMSFKKKENKKFESLLDHLELVGSMANPEAGKALKEAKELAKAKTELNGENFHIYFQELKKTIPNKLVVKPKNRDKNVFILPKYKGEERKQLGISIGKGGE